MTRAEFISKYYPMVERLSTSTKIFPETVFAQAIVESSNSKGEFGKSPLAAQANNYFGIKADESWNGEIYRTSTKEYNADGKLIGQMAAFRKYVTPEDSITDYFKFLVQNPRYAKAGVFSAPDWQSQVEALMMAGYAGRYNTVYADLLNKVGKSVSKMIDSVAAKAKKMTATPTGTGGMVLAALAIAGIVIFARSKNG